MTKWEYCAIRSSIADGKDFLKLFSASAGEPPKEIKDVHQTIAKLGLEGWELVTLTQINQPDARVYYFKRPV